MKKNLHNLKRIPEKGWISGVCAGIAYFFKIPLWLTRLVWMVVFFFALFWPATIFYILLWIFMPKIKEAPEDFDKAIN